MNKHSFSSGKISPQLEDRLARLRVVPIGNSPDKVYHSLALLDEARPEAPQALVVDNPSRSGMLFLLNQPHPLFFLGFDPEGNPTSKGVFPGTQTQGTNHVLLHDALVVILRSFEELTFLMKTINHKSHQP